MKGKALEEIQLQLNGKKNSEGNCSLWWQDRRPVRNQPEDITTPVYSRCFKKSCDSSCFCFENCIRYRKSLVVFPCEETEPAELLTKRWKYVSSVL
jgi:hypothetical protein